MKTKTVIYQVFPRLFGNHHKSPKPNGTISENGAGKFSAFTPEILNELKNAGFTHIWYTGVIEHATQTDYPSCNITKDHQAVVKGKAGSPYAIKDYYDVDPDLAEEPSNRMAEFEDLVRRTHEAGLEMIIDFVPNHVARQYHSNAKPPHIQDLGQHDNDSKAFDPNNNFYYLPNQSLVLHFGAQQEDYEYSEFPAKVTGNNCFKSNPTENDWYETIKLNYGVDYVNGGHCYFTPIPNTWTKMLDILLYWVDKGVDGFRCDMAEMVPVEFWNWVIPRVKTVKETCFIAEVYNPALYRDYVQRGHFDFLYDKAGMYDTLRNVICGRAAAYDITKCWQAVEGIQQHLVYFLENHDEQRIASDFFAGNAQAGFPGMIVAATMNTNPVLVYCGQEFGERGMDNEGFSGLDGRTTIFDYWNLPCIQQWTGELQSGEPLLTREQRNLHEEYVRLLRIVENEPAINSGAFFDLMYANDKNLHFNVNRQYAFLRKHEQEVILVVANFDPAEQTVRVRIPSEAFLYLNIPDNQAARLTDLFTGQQSISTLTAACPFEVTLPGYSGKLLKFKY
ncbi:MAG: alpha-glucosidase C-terminal domain-containing protein [Tannerella sp.]|nr:alpha-glucosidase C-terminal domain-containing protein [Tannerella sp.]